MDSVRLRDYGEADLATLHTLDQVCFPPGIAYSRTELRTFLEHPSSSATVAVKGQTILGFAIVRPSRRRLQGVSPTQMSPVLHVITIDVAPEARRKGIGALLMQWIFEKANQLRLHAIVLEVSVDNYTAQGFYQSLDFSITGTIPGYYNGVIDALELERRLS